MVYSTNLKPLSAKVQWKTGKKSSRRIILTFNLSTHQILCHVAHTISYTKSNYNSWGKPTKHSNSIHTYIYIHNNMLLHIPKQTWLKVKHCSSLVQSQPVMAASAMEKHLLLYKYICIIQYINMQEYYVFNNECSIKHYLVLEWIDKILVVIVVPWVNIWMNLCCKILMQTMASALSTFVLTTCLINLTTVLAIGL